MRASSGKILWQADIGSDVHSAPSVDAKNVYIGVVDNEVFAFNAKSGHARWTQQVDRSVQSAVSLAGGVVYAMTDAAIVYGLNTSTGAVLWSATAPPETFATQTSCAIAHGWLYAGFGTAGLMSFAPRRHND